MDEQPQAAPEEPTAAGPRAWLGPVLLAVVALAVSANTLGNGFSLDDTWLIVTNPRIDDPTYIRYMLFERDQLWRPVKRISFMADHALWGPERPWGFHLTNLLLHVACCLLLLVVGGRLGLPPPGALAGALLFAVHPAHVEAVANISHRKEPLALLFSLLALLTWLESRREGPPRAPIAALARRLRPGASLDGYARFELVGWTGFFYLMGMLSKEVGAVMLPALVLVHALLMRKGGAGDAPSLVPRRLLGFLIPVAVVLLLFTFRGEIRDLPGRFSGEQVRWVTFDQTDSYGVMVLSAIKAFGLHVKLLAWPWPLYVDRAFVLPRGVLDPAVLGGLLSLLAWGAGIALAWRRCRVLAFGLAWFGLNLLPVVNLIPLTFWMFAERFAYVPSAGAAWAAGAIFQTAWDRRLVPGLPEQRAVASSLLAVVLVVFGILTVRQNPVWKDDCTLWAHTLTHNPDSWMGWYGDGHCATIDQDRDRAEAAFRRSIELNPRYAEPRLGLALLLLQKGEYEETIEHARVHARADRDNAAPMVAIGNALYHQGKFEEAIEAYERAKERDPDHPGVTFNHANALRSLKRYDDALELIGPPSDDWPINMHYLRGTLLRHLGRLEEALQSFRRAREMEPDIQGIQTVIQTLERQLGR